MKKKKSQHKLWFSTGFGEKMWLDSIQIHKMCYITDVYGKPRDIKGCSLLKPFLHFFGTSLKETNKNSCVNKFKKNVCNTNANTNNYDKLCNFGCSWQTSKDLWANRSPRWHCVIWATGFGLTGKTGFDFSWIGEKTTWNLTPAKMSEWNQVWFSKSSTHKQSESLCGLNCGFVNRLMSKTSCVSHKWLSHPVIPACSPKTFNRNSHQRAFFQNH